MNQTLLAVAPVVRDLHTTPSICIVAPFEPQLHERSSIEARITCLLHKAEDRLLQQYSYSKVLPVISRVEALIRNISYYRYSKSIALVASPAYTRLLYLDFPVTETIRTGVNLGAQDIFLARKKDSTFLVLELEQEEANMYEGTALSLSLIKHNTPKGHCFYTDMDKGLHHILEAYRLPVFVMGDPSSLEAFKRITTHQEHIIDYVSGNFIPQAVNDMLKALRPVLAHWQLSKQQFLVKKLQKAKQDGQLCCGIHDTWETVLHKKIKLLVVEDSLRDEKLNDIIEQVLKDGGEVELVEEHALLSFGQIAVVTQYTAA